MTTPRTDRPTIYHHARVYAPGRPGATALVVAGGSVTYVGNDAGARAAGSGAVEVDLRGALLTPAFVDAHVHTIQTGQVMDGLDLSTARSRDDVLDAVAAFARDHPAAAVVVGQGWDERHWPDPRPPLRTELDRAGSGAAVYLARVDVHSAVVSTALLDQVGDVSQAPGYTAAGWLTQQAHHQCRGQMDRLFTDAERRAAARAALRRAAEVGIGTVHELSGPHLGPIEDLVRVREVGAELGIDIVGYWGELADPATIARARSVGTRGLAGDLCIDGAIGSRTAALREPYADHPSRGVRYLSEDEITEHLVACTRAGLQAGFHCIGDDAVVAAVSGLRRAAEQLGSEAIRSARHRLEHLEMTSESDMVTLADLGVTASMQPAFDAAWGGPGELYAERLGERSTGMNRLGTLHRHGVRMAFGSDAPVTPLAGWETVRAAVHHSDPAERLSPADAFVAATTGGHRAAGMYATGSLEPGTAATFAVWGDAELDLGGLPAMDRTSALPTCQATVVRGRAIWQAPSFPGPVE